MDGKESIYDTRHLPFPTLSMQEALRTAEYAALNRHTNRMRLERLPDDPPVPLEEMIQNLQSIPSFVDLRLWAAWTPAQDEIAALANVSLLRPRRTATWLPSISPCSPSTAARGWARQMLRRIAEAAAADQRRLLMTETNDRIPAGEAFMLRLGAQKGLEAHTNQLRIEDAGPRAGRPLAGAGPAAHRRFRARPVGWRLPRGAAPGRGGAVRPDQPAAPR